MIEKPITMVKIPSPRITWAALARWEPRLSELAREIRAIKDDKCQPAFCANAIWYQPGGFKDRLIHLVGWSCTSPVPQLHTSEAYELSSRILYKQLPRCRNCNCADESD